MDVIKIKLHAIAVGVEIHLNAEITLIKFSDCVKYVALGQNFVTSNNQIASFQMLLIIMNHIMDDDGEALAFDIVRGLKCMYNAVLCMRISIKIYSHTALISSN